MLVVIKWSTRRYSYKTTESQRRWHIETEQGPITAVLCTAVLPSVLACFFVSLSFLEVKEHLFFPTLKVSYIENRIAALGAAGMSVDTGRRRVRAGGFRWERRDIYICIHTHIQPPLLLFGSHLEEDVAAAIASKIQEATFWPIRPTRLFNLHKCCLFVHFYETTMYKCIGIYLFILIWHMKLD